MTVQSVINAPVQRYSLQCVEVAFAHESVNVVRYLPPLADPTSTKNDDIYAWLNIVPAVPGWLLRDTLWVCESADQAAALARLRARALRHTNMGDIFSAMGSLAATTADYDPQQAAFVSLHSEVAIDEDAHRIRRARRFVWCNLVLECAPSPHDAANQQRADRLRDLLQHLTIGESQ